MQVVRLSAGGTLDTTFGDAGRAVIAFGTSGSDLAYGVATQPDDKVILAHREMH